MTSKLFNIQGRVQGVSFRKATKDYVTLNSPTITGYVRNLNNGSVEVYASGSDAEISQLLLFLEKGSAFSKVEKIDCKDVELTQIFTTFSILRT